MEFRQTTRANDITVVVGREATITARSIGIVVGIPIPGGGSSDNDNSLVINAGSIVTQFSGVRTFGQGAQIINQGSVSSPLAISAFGDSNTVFNSGSIEGGSIGIDLSGRDGTIENAGDIAANTGVFMSLGGELINSGSIDGGLFGVTLNTRLDGTSTLINSGTINVASFEGGGGVPSVSGNIGAETVINTGSLVGNVDLHDGDDIYRGKDGRLFFADLFAGGGNDLVLGGIDDDRFFGQGDNDTLRGFQGADTLDGGGGADELRGGSGDDVLVGGASADHLFGGRGDDILRGGNGADVLTGGRGSDSLEGGARADVFVFGRGAGNDRITDFEHRLDLIDVSAFEMGGFGALSAAISTADGDTVIDWTIVGGAGRLTLEGFAGTIDAADFIF